MTTLGFGGRSAWPAVSYATALDYFVILCFAFVFAAVLEFACINFMERAVNKRRKKLEDLKRQIQERIMVCCYDGDSCRFARRGPCPPLAPSLSSSLPAPLVRDGGVCGARLVCVPVV